MALKYLYVPSGVKAGTAYGVLPNSANADFSSFSRSSAGSRVDKNGLIDTGLGLGSEEIVNGDFDSASNWETSVATISGGKAIFISATGAYSYVRQVGVLTQNKTYEVVIDLVVNSGNGVKLQDASGTTFGVISESGVHTRRFTATTTNSTFMIAREFTSGAYDMYVERVSVREVTEVNTDVPRLDYTGGGCPSLLLEDTSTNYLQYSEDFSQSFYTKSNASVSDYGETSPQGTYNAKTLTDSGAGGTGPVHFNRYSLGGLLPSDGDYAYSIFAKKGTRKICRIEVGNLDGIPNAVVNFNLDTGVIVSTSGTAFNSNLIEPYKNGWYKLSVTLTISNKQNNHFVRFRPLADDGNGNLNLDGTNTMHFFGSQVEKQSYATSYIPNYGTSAGVTRSGDNGANTGDISNAINEEEGVFLAYMAAHTSEAISAPQWITLSEGTSNNSYISIRYNTGANAIQVRYVANGGSAVQISTTSIDRSNFNKIAFRWKANDFSLWINGNLIQTETTWDIITANNLNRLTFGTSSNSQRLYGKVREIRIYDKYESDAEMTKLTTL